MSLPEDLPLLNDPDALQFYEGQLYAAARALTWAEEDMFDDRKLRAAKKDLRDAAAAYWRAVTVALMESGREK